MPRLNWTIISSNVQEAREQLEEIEASLAKGERPSPGRLEALIAHAYHHLNSAWNARCAPMREYRSLTDAKFNEWGRFPTELELPALER